MNPPEPSYEREDMRARTVMLAGLGLLAVLAAVLVFVTFFEAAMTGISPSISRPQDLIQGLRAQPAPTPPAPRLEAQPGDFAAYRAASLQRLESYRWVDRSSDVVAIPIDRAIELTAQRGLPARAQTAAGDTGSTSPSSASSGRVDEAYP